MSSSPSLLFTTSAALPTPTVNLGPATYDFQNYGPLTTTFTPAASCTNSPDLSIWAPGAPIGNPYVSRCTSDFGDAVSTSCIPGDAEKAQYIKDRVDDRAIIYRHIPYHSPANICPLAWTTVGVAYKDARGSLTASGDAFNPTDTLTITPLHDPTANIIAHHLKPLQTAIACCPEDYEGGHDGSCWYNADDASAWTASTACAFADDRWEGVVEQEAVYTYNGRVLTGYESFNTETGPLSVTATSTWSVDKSLETTTGNTLGGDLKVHAYVDQLFLIYGGDEFAGGSAGGNSTASSSAPVEPSASGISEPSGAARGIASAGVATLLAVWGVAGLFGAGVFAL
ncbi:hypothetical protein F5X68DRAFT_257911 [Plectosphaerella plurivora]|uniref:Uncharacterized protein n=1 Tax=Plectosphaerella plurivora TaxID=936078 RepID=A0A9P9AFE3_9PEZI|nr:hypothetical protein F5X68DRAFT_257911 [Plectosphaerella plurivora]